MHSLLIVDDEIPILDGLSELLRSAELPLKEVATAASARRALELFEEAPFDLVLADIRMPEMDGLDMIESMRAVWPKLKAIFLTGFQDFGYAKRAIGVGARDYLLKPARDEEVLASVRASVGELDAEAAEAMKLARERERIDAVRRASWAIVFEDALEYEAYASSAALERRFSLLEIPLDARSPVSTAIVRIDQPEGIGEGGDIEEELQEAASAFVLLFGPRTAVVSLRSASTYLSILTQEDSGVSPGRQLAASRMLAVTRKKVEEAQDRLWSLGRVSISCAFTEPCAWEAWPQAYRRADALLRRSATRSSLIASSSKAQDEEEGSCGDSIVEAIRAFVLERPGEELSLSALSARFRINPSYLSRLFLKSTGMHLSTYVTQTRIAKAKRLLLGDGERINEIARAIGYEDPNYFARVFRKEIGVTPQEYRMLNIPSRD
jgi:Response regulator containing CheY-like receiver domain and AraC-type DNA-binding domain